LLDVVREKPEGPILFFAPEAPILDYIKSLAAGPVVTTAYSPDEEVDFPGEDIQRLTLADNSYALILCNHVLEHVADDQLSLLECARVLKPNGIAVFTIPGNFSESSTWHFDKPDGNGHYRHYGMDVVGKMRMAFSQVRAVDMSESSEPRWRVRKADYVFVCTK
jgi:ubiquinone/menaquinone biosynthesis C-methylase UbiE